MNYNNLLNKDFRYRTQAPHKQHPLLKWGLFTVGSIVLGVVVASTSDYRSSTEKPLTEEVLSTAPTEHPLTTQNTEDAQRLSLSLAIPEPQFSNKAMEQSVPEPRWESFKVKSGDSLSVLFDRANISASELAHLLKLKHEIKPLLKIHPGEVINIRSTAEGELSALKYDIDYRKSLLIEKQNDQFIANTIEHNIEYHQKHATGIINDSLFAAGQQAGITDNLIMELAAIFGWDIDFVLDIRKGDSFTLLYEEIYKDGNKLKDGNILAAEFVNHGKTYRAVRYEDPKTKQASYYDEDGNNLRKAFLRSPVKFSYISSKFTTSRYHPVLHKYRSHKGIDYAAARGTPVRASGEGKIVFRGKKGGYGNVVIIKHGSRYSTLYAHLSKFNRTARAGSRVKQGQVIGYVGSTGLATGPHLHYEFRVNGVHRNPLRVKFPSANPVPAQYLTAYNDYAQPLLAQLDVISRNVLALNQ